MGLLFCTFILALVSDWKRDYPPNRTTPKTVVLRGSLCLPFLIMRLLCRAPKKLRGESR